MGNLEHARIIKRAVDIFGFKSQSRVLQEECAELIVAVNHYERGREGAIDNFVEELADVSIMIEQMVYALGVDLESEVERKLQRLNKFIDESGVG